MQWHEPEDRPAAPKMAHIALQSRFLVLPSGRLSFAAQQNESPPHPSPQSRHGPY